MHNVNTRSVWLISLAIQSYNNGCIQCGWGNNVLKYGSFDIFETILLQVGATWKGLHTLVRPS